ncbi:MAG: sugar phosphate nucleotidyltransferase, partial [Coprobacillaceae bacterium]
MKKVIGLVNLHSDIQFQNLTENRPVASVNFLGRYGLIDFALSNLSNSGIDAVGVLIKEKPRSLFKHIGDGHSWNFNSKTGGVSLLYDEKYSRDVKYNHDVHNLIENIAFLEKTNSDIVVIAPAHIITTLDYSEIIEIHRRNNADITMVYQHIINADTSYLGNQVLQIKDDIVEAIDTNKGVKNECDISLETYIINTRILLKLLIQAKRTSAFFSIKDTLAHVLDERKVYAYHHTSYARSFESLKSYYKNSLELLNENMYS